MKKYSAHALAQVIDLPEPENDVYANSPWKPLQLLNPKSKGSKMEKLFHHLWEHYRQDIAKTEGTDSDRSINDIKVEIKGSFLYAPYYKHYRWQQLRTDQDYDWVVFLGFHPDYLEIYAATKETLQKHVFIQNDDGTWPYAQHGGKKVKNPNTFAINGMPSDFEWMQDIHDTELFTDVYSLDN